MIENMKTAEQWAEEWLGRDFNPESSLVKKFKQIQLDAYKAGMQVAINILKHDVETCPGPHEVRSNCQPCVARNNSIIDIEVACNAKKTM